MIRQFWIVAFAFISLLSATSNDQFLRKMISPQKAVEEGYPPTLQKHIFSNDNNSIIYYDTSGIFAVDSVDFNGNGIPDYVDYVKDAIDSVWYFEITFLGHKPPLIPSWSTKPFPIYLNENRSAYGATYFIPPGELQNDFTSYPAYIQLNPHFSNTLDKRLIRNAIDVTLAHEFYHAIQFSYGVRFINNSFEDLWLLEETATAFEEFIFDDVNDYYQYLPAIQNYPWELGLISNSPSSYYGHCLFFIMLAEQTGNVGFMKTIWEEQFNYPGEESIPHLAGFLNKDINEIFENYFIWRFHTGTLWEPSFFEEGMDYPDLQIYNNISLEEVSDYNNVKNWGFEGHTISSSEYGYISPTEYPTLVIENGGMTKWVRDNRALAIEKNRDYIVSFWDSRLPLILSPDKRSPSRLLPNPVLQGRYFLLIEGAEPGEKIEIFNIIGKEIFTLEAGLDGYSQWKMENFYGQKIAAGIYFFVFRNSGYVEKCVVLK